MIAVQPSRTLFVVTLAAVTFQAAPTWSIGAGPGDGDSPFRRSRHHADAGRLRLRKAWRRGSRHCHRATGVERNAARAALDPHD